MTDKVSRLRDEVEALRLECGDLRAMLMAQQQQQTDGGDYDAVVFRAPGTPDDKRLPSKFPPRRPFDIWYDPVQEEWKIYLPDSCVMVGDTAATYKEGTADGVAQITLAADLYCHVYAEESSGYTYGIDDTEEDESATLTFPVAKCSRDLTEVEAQFVSGLVLLEHKKLKKAYVVTRVRETMTESEGIVLHVTRAPILVDVPSGSESSASLDESSSSTTVATFVSVTYVTGSVYDPSGHVFKNKRRTVKAIISTDNESSDSVTVFTAEPVCGG